MVSELQLHGNELLAYALIYGFSQDGESCYKGSVQYLQDWLDISDRTAKTLLAGLVEKGLLKKWQEQKNGRLLNLYSVNLDALEPQKTDRDEASPMGEEVSPDGGRNYPQMGEEISPDGGKNFTRQGVISSPRLIKGKLKGNIQGNISPNAESEPREHGSPQEVFESYAGDDDTLRCSLMALDEYRRKSKAAKSWNGVSADRICKKLRRLADEAGVENRTRYMIACIDQSIENGWTTVYPVSGYAEQAAQAKIHAVGGQDNPRMLTPDMDIRDFL